MSVDERESLQKATNVKLLIFELLHKWYYIVAPLILCAIITLFYSYIIAVPEYDSTAKIYIMNKSQPEVSTNDITVSSYLAKDYIDLIVDRAVLEEVAKRLGNKYTYEYLKSIVSVENPVGTRFIEITARTEKADKSKEIVDKVCMVSQEKIVKLLGIDQVNVVRQGNISNYPSSPNVLLNLLKGLLIGFISSVFILFFIYVQNDKINTPDDIKKYLGVSILGVIPYNANRQK